MSALDGIIFSAPTRVSPVTRSGLLSAHVASQVSPSIHTPWMPCARCSVPLDASSHAHLDAATGDYFCEPCAIEAGITAHIGGLRPSLPSGPTEVGAGDSSGQGCHLRLLR